MADYKAFAKAKFLESLEKGPLVLTNKLADGYHSVSIYLGDQSSLLPDLQNDSIAAFHECTGNFQYESESIVYDRQSKSIHDVRYDFRVKGKSKIPLILKAIEDMGWV